MAGVSAIAVTLMSAAGLDAQQNLLPGRLTGSVVSRANPAQRYAVYLPTSFKPNTPAPVLFIMDYRGRARVAADVFRPAAEKYGWILMSSNDTSSDEAAGPSLEALKAMWTDAHDLFNVDPRRLYLAGLSGTARTATWIATEIKGTVAGVIGASAGLSPLLSPSADLPFAYFGTAGDADYNYWEMRLLERRLSELGVPHRMEYFSGVHGWMPTSLAMSAIGWMELRAMRTGLRPPDARLIEELWWQDQLSAEMLEESGRSAAASRRRRAMLRDYEGLRPAGDLAGLRQRDAALNAEPWLPEALAAEEAAAAAHKKRIDESMQIIARAYPKRSGKLATSVQATLDELRVPELLAAASGRDQAMALDAKRILAELDVQTGFYLPQESMQEQDDARAGFYLDLAKAINPEDPFAWFLRARVSARADQATETMENLARAVKLGFRTLDALETDHVFDSLRTRADFRALVDIVRAAWDAAR